MTISLLIMVTVLLFLSGYGVSGMMGAMLGTMIPLGN